MLGPEWFEVVEVAARNPAPARSIAPWVLNLLACPRPSHDGQFAATLVLLLSFISLFFWLPRLESDRRRCSSCRYDLVGLADNTVCPECGSCDREHADRPVNFAVLKRRLTTFAWMPLILLLLLPLLRGLLGLKLMARWVNESGVSWQTARVHLAGENLIYHWNPEVLWLLCWTPSLALLRSRKLALECFIIAASVVGLASLL